MTLSLETRHWLIVIVIDLMAFGVFWAIRQVYLSIQRWFAKWRTFVIQTRAALNRVDHQVYMMKREANSKKRFSIPPPLPPRDVTQDAMSWDDDSCETALPEE